MKLFCGLSFISKIFLLKSSSSASLQLPGWFFVCALLKIKRKKIKFTLDWQLIMIFLHRDFSILLVCWPYKNIWIAFHSCDHIANVMSIKVWFKRDSFEYLTICLPDLSCFLVDLILDSYVVCFFFHFFYFVRKLNKRLKS